MVIKRKEITFKCYKCSGKGYLKDNIECDVCEGTGKFKDSNYYFIDEKNKIAFDGDTLK